MSEDGKNFDAAVNEFREIFRQEEKKFLPHFLSGYRRGYDEFRINDWKDRYTLTE